MKFKIYTLGCKVNAYESEMMKEKLLNKGYVISENDIRKVRGEELIKEDNGSGRLKKQTQKNKNAKLKSKEVG